jgi:cell division protein FtsN
MRMYARKTLLIAALLVSACATQPPKQAPTQPAVALAAAPTPAARAVAPAAAEDEPGAVEGSAEGYRYGLACGI